MKKSIILLTMILISCNFSQGNDRFVRKSFDDGTIKVNWYYLSYISDVSPDFVEVVKGDSAKTIFKAKDVITDVKLKNNTIYISLFEPSRGVVYSKEVSSEVFDYQIVVDSLTTIEDYKRIPDGKKN